VAAALGSSVLLGEPAQVNPPAAEPESPPQPQTPVARPTGRSLVAVAHDLRAMDGFDENAAVTRRMVDALARTVTGCSDTRAAWREFAGTDTRVGIKVTASGGPYFSTRRGVVAAVVAGLRDAGVREIIVWDKNAADLRSAGFTPQRLGCEVRAIDPPHGWDRASSFQAPALGKLIWGDLLFSEKVNPRGLGSNADDLLSSKSHLATILSKDVPRFINIAALSDEPGCGVAGALHSAVVGNLDNWRRFTTAAHPPSPTATPIRGSAANACCTSSTRSHSPTPAARAGARRIPRSTTRSTRAAIPSRSIRSASSFWKNGASAQASARSARKLHGCKERMLAMQSAR